jgi:hypothetical protein
MGSVHVELCDWLQREDANSHQLVLMPRDHGKSRYAAYYSVWRATKNPSHTNTTSVSYFNVS